MLRVLAHAHTLVYPPPRRFGPQLCDLTTQDLQSRDVLARSLIHVYPLQQPPGIAALPYNEAEQVARRTGAFGLLMVMCFVSVARYLRQRPFGARGEDASGSNSLRPHLSSREGTSAGPQSSHPLPCYGCWCSFYRDMCWSLRHQCFALCSLRVHSASGRATACPC
jgi:hypothetical protein